MNIFTITWLSYAGYYFCRKPFSQAKNPLAYQMEISDTEIAHIGTAFLVAYMLGQFATAWIAKRASCRRILLFGMGASLLSSFALGAAIQNGPEAYEPFLGLMVINGLAQGTGWGACIGILAHWFARQERGTVLAFWATCYMLGSVAAKGMASFILGLDTETRVLIGPEGVLTESAVATNDALTWMFCAAAGVLTLIWLCVLFFVHDRPKDYGLSSIVTEELPLDSATAPGGRLGWSPNVKRTIILMGVSYFCFKFVRYALDSWSPLLIEEVFGSATDVAGYQSAAFDLAGFAGVIFAGVTTDRYFRSGRSMVTFLMTLGMCFALIFMSTLGTATSTLFIVGLAITGFMLAGPDSLLSGVGSIDVASKRGAVAAAAIINGIGSLGAVAQEQIIGRILDQSATTNEALDDVLLVLVTAAAAGVITCAVLLHWKRTGRSTL